ncbi:MAG TPA: hypothetical protein ENI70_01945, partial [Candidatus Peregrinibacteria bacterium]|nr:hypothetical protein [Candidatus Peregrinibacteria bacterium]
MSVTGLLNPNQEEGLKEETREGLKKDFRQRILDVVTVEEAESDFQEKFEGKNFHKELVEEGTAEERARDIFNKVAGFKRLLANPYEKPDAAVIKDIASRTGLEEGKVLDIINVLQHSVILSKAQEALMEEKRANSKLWKTVGGVALKMCLGVGYVIEAIKDRKGLDRKLKEFENTLVSPESDLSREVMATLASMLTNAKKEQVFLGSSELNFDLKKGAFHSALDVEMDRKKDQVRRSLYSQLSGFAEKIDDKDVAKLFNYFRDEGWLSAAPETIDDATQVANYLNDRYG